MPVRKVPPLMCSVPMFWLSPSEMSDVFGRVTVAFVATSNTASLL